MAKRPRVFSITKQNGRISFNDAGDGRQYLVAGIRDIGEGSADDVMVYGLTQIILDAGATNDGLGDRLKKMRERWDAIQAGTGRIGERIASGLVMADTFRAARAVGLWRKMTDDEARDAWKKLTDFGRAQVAGKPEVIAEMAKSRPDAESELDSMFE